jgi:predicted Zn-dependent protease with MMP-like domain
VDGPEFPAARPGSRRRDRRGRGRRGPDVLPRVPGTPATRTRRQRFDALVLDVAASLEERWGDRLGLVEYAVEDVPTVPDDWSADDRVPLASLVPGSGGRPPRIVVFRRPLEQRADTDDELGSLVLTVVVEQVAELLGLPPERVDPRWSEED